VVQPDPECMSFDLNIPSTNSSFLSKIARIDLCGLHPRTVVDSQGRNSNVRSHTALISKRECSPLPYKQQDFLGATFEK
jgi:hypothetical protein